MDQGAEHEPQLPLAEAIKDLLGRMGIDAEIAQDTLDFFMDTDPVALLPPGVEDACRELHRTFVQSMDPDLFNSTLRDRLGRYTMIEQSMLGRVFGRIPPDRPLPIIGAIRAQNLHDDPDLSQALALSFQSGFLKLRERYLLLTEPPAAEEP